MMLDALNTSDVAVFFVCKNNLELVIVFCYGFLCQVKFTPAKQSADQP